VTIASLIMAAGGGTRLGGLPKQYRPLGASTVLGHAIDALSSLGPVQVVIGAEQEPLYQTAIGSRTLPSPIIGGATRQESVRLGLEALGNPDWVFIHDAARPFVPAAVLDRLRQALDDAAGAIPVLPVVDSLIRDGSSVERDGLLRVQTPQAFRYGAILNAHRSAALQATDDAALLRAQGIQVAEVPGDERSFKITHAEDLERAAQMLAVRTLPRTGFGYDVHRFGANADGSHDHVWLCGVKVPHDTGILAHSDGDVGLHALTDAILGALGDGDIGQHFPPSDPQWRGASSDRFLAHAAQLVAQRGGRLSHVDVTLVCERPKVGAHREAMRARLAALLGLPLHAVSVKATTTEGLGFTGRKEGIAAHAVATMLLPEPW
jgi:2-C-methyl-D-erythritol 4-phosphate cytidylyltransferase / 2-C-methyl-D-erythritol 2,4-cyclodiphosphate synthase